MKDYQNKQRALTTKMFDRSIVLFGLIPSILILNGCMPFITHCKGDVIIQLHKDPLLSSGKETTHHFIIVSFWDYPTVNEKEGEIVINEVIVTEKKHLIINFPYKGYMAIWTPVLGTQHLAPEPGIIVFHENFPPSWNVGGTEPGIRICCEKPETEHEFKMDLFFDDVMDQDSYSSKTFLEKFLTKREDLILKLNHCKELSSQEKAMVMEKLRRSAKTLGI